MGNTANRPLPPITQQQPVTQHQAVVVHHADGSKTISLSAPAPVPLVGKSAYKPVAGCMQTSSPYCNGNVCSMLPGTPGSYCCSRNGTYCSGQCFGDVSQACPHGERVFPCIGCTPN